MTHRCDLSVKAVQFIREQQKLLIYCQHYSFLESHDAQLFDVRTLVLLQLCESCFKVHHFYWRIMRNPIIAAKET